MRDSDRFQLTQATVGLDGLRCLTLAVTNLAPVVDLDGTGSFDDIGDVAAAVDLSSKKEEESVGKKLSKERGRANEFAP